MGYQVVVVDDDALAGAQWAIAKDGRGETYLLVARSALANPERCLTRAWNVWEATMRPELVSA